MNWLVWSPEGAVHVGRHRERLNDDFSATKLNQQFALSFSPEAWRVPQVAERFCFTVPLSNAKQFR